MKLTNKEKQKELDFTKWNLSQIEHRDMSGEMNYCQYCDYRNEHCFCTASQEEREADSLCAKAFNKGRRYNG